MNVYVVLYESFEEKTVEVLGVYTDKEMANSRVKFERSRIESNPNQKLRDECW